MFSSRLFCCLVLGFVATARAQESAPVLNPDLPTIFIAGDSTAARNGNPDIQGWAEPFAAFFDDSAVNVANRARGGRSSRTFITEGHWAKLLAELKAGDVVLIQFGHNDGGAINREPEGSSRPLRARGSLPGLGDETEAIDNAVTGKPEVVRTFGAYVREMIADVHAREATPILVSLTIRDIWKAGKVERGSGRYRDWLRTLAAEAELGFVDLTRLAADVYQELGEPASKTFYTADYVHTNDEGARLHAALVLSGLKGLRRGAVDVTPWLSRTGTGVPKDSIGWLNLPEPADPDLLSIVLIGDSTVRNGGGDGGGGQWGWGEPLAEILDATEVNVVNRAIGGLSSRTFLTQGHWSRAKMLLKPGDWVLMQFGHNDAAPLTDARRARGTMRTAGHETQAVYNLLTHETEVVHTYGDYLRRYIKETRELGAHPVVCTPVPRKKWDDATGLISRGGPDSYAAIARQVAAEEGVPVIDLNALVAGRYDALSHEEVDTLFGDAHTHTSRLGAELTAAIVAEAWREIAAHAHED
ncbi:rhamnogalacturonan acetylesterase [Synoicihabitans lomoniglobus]|uniref:Rhamnogalacturonan acetylesterase n=1 Tax=Synoicihabitans lomoniglobus TaxID=2909285 RepID=A0AAF0CMK1_9BACT|nr:rhamnogalacturonan acetylesterase [Opitutaceae bacterium LMO-M01]WED64248.1 rhamnogalacturonan acetylesterase [Opitutaceae bacterium LMO-M01]